jgi:D-glycero-alpha-D-manno-heptose-7-phosphate kinase
MTSVFRGRAPLRLGLAGGGTDVSPYSDLYGGYVLNATIDLYAHAFLTPTTDNTIEFIASDINQRCSFHSDTVLPTKGGLGLYSAIYNRVIREFRITQPLSFSLLTFADAPPGSGLGTSSTMVVCILQVLNEWLNLGLGEYDIAKLAYAIERQDMGLSGGKQDQYAAAFGGINFMEFGPGPRVLVNPLRIKPWILNELEASTVLYYTGASRLSSGIISEQVQKIEQSNQVAVNASHQLKQDALRMKEAILFGDLRSYVGILNSSWEAKKQISSKVTNQDMDATYAIAMNAGACGGKLLGAGGGGVFMFLIPTSGRSHLERCLEKAGGKILRFHFTDRGPETWTIGETNRFD